MHGKICLITGANAGLGRAIAAGLARLGAGVILGCRDRGRGEAALSEISSATGSETIELMLVDLSSQQSVRAIAADVRRQHGRLDVLINNAAIFKNSRSTTADGYETMFATNHLGPFLLTNLLLDVLKAGAPARIVNITAPSTTRLDFDDLQGEKSFRALSAFGASKMCNLLFTYELARRLAGSGVTANAVHPGLVKSNIMGEAPAPVRWLTGLFSSPPERAAETPIYLASSPEVADVTGQFFKDKRPIDSSAYSKDLQVQRRLWDVSAGLVQL
jgi:NAD(P)-dependent dehydrogenase (short-subunit alcohol dehydrogenase family)